MLLVRRYSVKIKSKGNNRRKMLLKIIQNISCVFVRSKINVDNVFVGNHIALLSIMSDHRFGAEKRMYALNDDYPGKCIGNDDVIQHDSVLVA